MRVDTSDGVELEVRVAGTGPSLLLVHGFGGAADDFGDHVEALAATHRVVAFDLRGHGRSGRGPGTEYSLDRMARDVVEIADALEAGSFRLLGHSMGGMVARRVLVADPGRVEAAVLMSTAGGPPDTLSAVVMDVAAEIALRDGMRELKRVMDAFDPLETPQYRRLVETRPGYEAFCAWKWDCLDPEMYAAMLREMTRQDDDHDVLATLGVPTLVLVGSDDELFLEPSRHLAATVPGAQLVVVADAAHSPQFETPAIWRESVTTFLASLDSAHDLAAAG